MNSLAKKINADNVKIESTEHTTEIIMSNCENQSIYSPGQKKPQEDNMKNDSDQV